MTMSAEAPRHRLVALLYALVAIGLLAPMASNTNLPFAPDHANHTGIIVQARMAIEDGQFPIRVAPWQYGGWLLPLYAFYSPFTYEVAGRVYRWLAPDNPFVAYKITLWAALVCGGFFFYLTSWEVTRRRGASLLAGLAYMSAPYLMVNVHARGAFTEAVAQGLLPVVLFCAWRCFNASWRSPWLFVSAVSWGLLALTHNITYLSTGAFLNVMFLLLSIGWRGPASGFWRTTAASAAGVLLGIHLLAADLIGHEFLQIRDWMSSLGTSNWLTQLPTLTALHALPPELRPGINPVSVHLSPAIGWPILLAVALTISLRPTSGADHASPDTRRLSIVLLVLFLFAAFLTWSPFDFWRWLPSQVQVAQFSYRFLTQVSWIGGLLVALALARLYPGEMPGSHVLVGALLIVFAHASYLPRTTRGTLNAATIAQTPDIGYGQGAYLVVGYPDVKDVGGTLSLPLVYRDRWLIVDRDIALPVDLFSDAKTPELILQGLRTDDGSSEPIALTLLLDGHQVASTQVGVTGRDVTFPLNGVIAGEPPTELRFDVNRSFVPSQRDPASLDTRTLAVRVGRVALGGLPVSGSMTVAETEPLCQRSVPGGWRCRLSVQGSSTLVQLPQLFYPGMLQTQVDGREVPTVPTVHETLVLAGVRLDAGVHDVQVRFRGVPWANRLSAIAWIATLGGLVAAGVQSRLRRAR